MKKILLLVLLALLAAPVWAAGPTRDDDDKDPSIRRGIRRLHPERERAKAMKKLQEQLSHKAEPKEDPWDTSDEVWGTVDVPRTAVLIDSSAVVGHYRDDVDAINAGRASGRPSVMATHRMVWRDEPVTARVDELMPLFTIDDRGDCFSRYADNGTTSNEVFFAFALNDSNEVAGPLRLCVHYCADSPLNYDQVTFNIDGFDYLFYPSNPQAGAVGDGRYWEMSDDELHPSYRDLIYALAHSHWVIVKLTGRNGVTHARMLSDGQRDDFANTLALFRLLGGEL